MEHFIAGVVRAEGDELQMGIQLIHLMLDSLEADRVPQAIAGGQPALDIDARDVQSPARMRVMYVSDQPHERD